MPFYSASIHIASPPASVFGVVADLARHGEWSADPLDLTPNGDGRYTSRATSKGKEITAELTLIESHAPSRFVFDAADLTGRWRHTFTLTPSEGGTMLRREIAGELSGMQLLLYWLVVLPIKKPNARRALARLKHLVESATQL